MASGFGYFEGNAVALSTNNGIIVAAKVEQSVNTSARTVTVSVTAYVGYKRMAGGSWTITPDNTRIWQTNHSDAYLSATVGNTTNKVSPSFGAFVNGVQTVNTGTILTVYAGQLKGTTTWSGTSYTNYVVASKTYSYGTDGAAISDTWSVRIHEYDSTYGWKDSSKSGSFTTDSITPSYTAPTGLTATWGSHTWNSVTGSVSITSYGNPSSASGRYVEFGVCSSSNTSYGPPYRCANQVNATSATKTITTSSSGSGLTIKGAMDYKIGGWATNTQLTASKLNSTVYHTPPAPLQSLTKTSETAGSTAVATVFTIVGGDSTNNTSNGVATEIRISTNGGSSYGAWTAVGTTGNAWTLRTHTASIPYGASVKVQARQRYSGQYSEIKELSYTAMAATPPVNPVVTVNSISHNSVNLSGAIDNYGTPNGVSTRRLDIGLATSASASAPSMEKQGQGLTSLTGTIDNNSIAIRDGFTLKGMMTVYPYTWATNGATDGDSYVFGSAITLAPAPGILSYSIDPNNEQNQTISYVGVAADNIGNYDPTLLTRTVRYADSSDPTNWAYIENDTQIALTTATTQQITVPASHSIVVEAWMTYNGNNSQVSTVTLTNSQDPKRIYCSMGDLTEALDHIYGSVNGETKKLIKVYGSVNGVAKLIHEDI